MEKRPPANVGDLERQREKHVHLLGGSERSGKLGLTANASYPIPTPFPGIDRPSSTKQFIELLLCLFTF